MSGAICHWCGGYLDGFDEHDEDECYRKHQRQVYAAGGAAAKAALADARRRTTTEEETST